METIDFRTKTYLNDRGNPHTPGFWECAIDVGYSGTKAFSPNSISSFPSFAMPVTGGLLEVNGESSNHDIYYKEKNGQIWRVGKCAQDKIKISDPNTSSLSIYGRSRYFSDMFKVISDTSLGLSLRENKFGSPKGNRIMLQTGLPNRYLKSDGDYIKEVFAGRHIFSLKLGTGPWIDYDFEIDINDISVMPQPLGSFMGLVTDNEGKTIPDVKKYYESKLIVVDPGFGTMDCFPVESKEFGHMETFDNLGMKAVMESFSQKIYDKHKMEIPVPAIQKVLETGEITVYDRKTHTSSIENVKDLLEEANREVAFKVINKLRELYNDLIEYDYLVLTGGAGAAWEPYLKEGFEGMSGLTIVNGNKNDNLPFIFSNVRGYYLYLVQKTAKLVK